MNYKGPNAGQMANCLPWVSCHVQTEEDARKVRTHQVAPGPPEVGTSTDLLGKPGENNLIQGGCLGPPGEPLLGTGHAEGHRRDLVAELNTDDTANRAPWWDVPAHP